MKARYNPLSNSQRRAAHKILSREVAEHIDKERDQITYRVLGLVCLALNEEPTLRLGRIRLSRVIKRVGEKSKEHLEEWVNEGVGDYILAKHLRRIKMYELADIIEENERKSLGDAE